MTDGTENVTGVVLLAEDDENDVALFKRAFRKAEIDNRLRVVHDGDELIQYLKGEGKFSDRTTFPFPVLLLLDLSMPRTGGLEIIGWMRQQPETRQLRVIVVTGSSDYGQLKRAYELGADSFIAKSPNMEQFVRELRDVKRHWL